MARKPKITNQQILEAAREVFLQKGFGGSTLEIAQRASISEASIFKRFSTKEELFFAAMGIPEKPLWIQELETLSGTGNLKENLTKVCHQILEFYSEVMPRIMMLRSRGNALPETEFGGQEPRPIRDVKILSAFLELEMQQGRLRSCDAPTVAHILLGSLMNYVLLKQMSSRINWPIDEAVTDTFQPSQYFATEKLQSEASAVVRQSGESGKSPLDNPGELRSPNAFPEGSVSQGFIYKHLGDFIPEEQPKGSSNLEDWHRFLLGHSGIVPLTVSDTKDQSSPKSLFVQGLVDILWQGIAPN
ncbi:TetR/AcrR family transcriptional regulator [Nostocaceae cyanobacterium CENA369]|uniref:TetR/AcrR family transcriptional regulator n=1 Tax=Dendronalium phyllosphericum CENA369 TaxID=1725256 RepID=A0A8J7IJ84_9NOST|nr:TetR/AcrR family transcriptional regulator [Dendronalium phyllosphericum]MBH8577716.1 TetR/AcrR family transcriptional regulator [Dendronalium phyllosphericum CENA369]